MRDGRCGAIRFDAMDRRGRGRCAKERLTMLDAATADSLAHLLSSDSLGMPESSQLKVLGSTMGAEWLASCLVVQRLSTRNETGDTRFPQQIASRHAGWTKPGRR
ncbi:hypothetical protein LZ30DRAFT_701059 [Colletotrichum cereale]|nr:hypothetical protein LZ30DRAFT_701059 [Colletotrichum cereale]